MSGEYVMRTYGTRFDTEKHGQYLLHFEVDAFNGRGLTQWTPDVAKAMRFDSATALLRFWRTQSTVRPTRPDGKPNRPLTAHTIEPVELDDDGQPKLEALP